MKCFTALVGAVLASARSLPPALDDGALMKCEDKCETISAGGQYFVSSFRDHAKALFQGRLDYDKLTVKHARDEGERTAIQTKRKDMRERLRMLNEYTETILDTNRTFFRKNCAQIVVTAHLVKLKINNHSNSFQNQF